MKKSVFIIIGLFVSMVIYAQAPQAFKYQAVARSNTGSVLANQSVSFRISILRHNLTGDIVYAERHNTNTNEFGLVTLDIGNGILVSGNMAGINWGADTYFIRIEMDPNGGTAYQLMGSSQLLSVPYALHAKTVEIATDATLTGLGTTASPLQVANNGINSTKIIDGTIANADLANNSVTGSKIVDGTIVANDLADNAVTVSKISSSGAATDKVLTYSGSDVIWDYAPGSQVKLTVSNTGCFTVATFGSTSYVKIADIASFVKVISDSRMEVTFEGRVWAQTMTGTGAHFEMRIDNIASTMGDARVSLKTVQAGGTGEHVSITGIFTGLTIGTHTISMWIKGTGGGGTNGGVDPGCYSDDHMIIREIK